MRWQEPHEESVREILDGVHNFCEKEVPQVYATHEHMAKFPTELVKKMGELGLFGLTIPEEYGGMGMNTVASSYVARELAYWWPALHLIWTANSSLAAFPIMYAGTEEQKKRMQVTTKKREIETIRQALGRKKIEKDRLERELKDLHSKKEIEETKKTQTQEKVRKGKQTAPEQKRKIQQIRTKLRTLIQKIQKTKQELQSLETEKKQEEQDLNKVESEATKQAQDIGKGKILEQTTGRTLKKLLLDILNKERQVQKANEEHKQLEQKLNQLEQEARALGGL